MKNLGKKLIAMVLFFSLISPAGLFANYPVIDVANLMQAIETAYQYYQQVQNTIEQVQNTYKQIEQAAQQMKSINFNELKDLGKNFDGMKDNPFEVITGIHDSAHDITREVNKQMNKVNDLQDALHAETISFGGIKYSMADLCGATAESDKNGRSKNIFGFVENAWDYSRKQKDEAVKGYVEGLSYKEKEAIVRHFGMSPRNYASIELGKYELAKLTTASNVLGTETALENHLNEIIAEQSAINKMAEELPDGSVYAATQMTNSTLGVLLREMGNLTNAVNRGIGLQSNAIATNAQNEAIKEQEQKEMDEIKAARSEHSAGDPDQ